MGGSLSLNGTWGLTYAEGSQLMTPDHYTGPSLRGRQLIPAAVPAPIHRVLMDAGLLDDPNVGMNSLKARWVEEAFWIYRHTFVAPAEALDQAAWLVFEKLEYDATIWLNSGEVGHHANANRPARFNVTGKLRAGDNLLVVRVSTGIHSCADKPVADYFSQSLDLITRRIWHRKPQYQGGWDWNARLVNVGILGDVTLEWRASPRLDQVTVFAVSSEDLSTATLYVRATVEGLRNDPTDAVLRARILETGQEAVLPIRVEKNGTGSISTIAPE